jgi:uncharacterized membrane protein YqaE (UPF0057 family)
MLALLAIVCPPLAVLATRNRSATAANVGLTLLGFVPGVVHALRTVEQHTIERQYDSVMRVLERRAA